MSTDGTFETSLHCTGFSSLGDDSDDLFGFQYLADRHGDRLPRNFRKIAKPPLTDLLSATRFVQINDQVRLFGFEVGGWIIEG